MARFITDHARHITAVAQQFRNSCWFGCYKMLLLGSNNPRASEKVIKKRLKDAGIDVKTAISSGLAERDFVKAANALKMGHATTEKLTTIGGLLNQLQMRGALWTAVKISGDDGEYGHIVLLLGVDTGKKQVYYIDPWRRMTTDTVEKKWVSYSGMRTAFKGTKSVTGGCQYVTWNTLL